MVNNQNELYSRVEEVITDIKDTVEEKDMTYMKFKTLLGKLDYQRRSDQIMELITGYIEENDLVAVENSRSNKKINWDDIDFNDNITFKSKSEFYNDNSGIVKVSNSKSPYNLYLHQKEAIKKINETYSKGTFSGILSIPTGGGKTLTAVQWLLKNAIDQNKKVLWIAHRHELLNQAFNALHQNAYSDLLKNKKEFRYHMISGQHDRSVNLQPDDDFVIASKDSLYYNTDYLIDNWLDDNEEVFLVIDEAHHSTAKTYRKIINAVKENVDKASILGLTATPFRTSEDEYGLLKKIFKDDLLYKVDLEKLINRGILSAPIFREYNTQLDIYKELNDQDVKKIQAFDLKGDIADKIAQSKERNKRIVDHYLENKNEYGKLLVFTIDISHAIVLNRLFNKNGVSSEFIVSSIRNEHGVTVSQEDNAEKVEKFRNDEIDVLVNVNILTEGVDLPNVETVFLTRPTISTILMTQMIGRALRGTKAGGTEEAYIVSFIDNWRDKINWVNPERLYLEENVDFKDKEKNTEKELIRLVSINKIEEFADIMDDSVDTSSLEALNFLERVPKGLYSFSVLIKNENGKEEKKNCEILIYNNTKEVYEEFISDLDSIFDHYDLNDQEYLDEDKLENLFKAVEEKYFIGRDMIPGYKKEDIKDIIRYYALKGFEPGFLELENRNKFNLSKEAEYIYENSLGGREETDYINKIWSAEDNFWKVFFNHNKSYFIRQLNIEKEKIAHPELFEVDEEEPVIIADKVDIEDLTMSEIKNKNPKYWRKLNDAVYEKYQDENGYYHSAEGNFKSKSKFKFQIDHIKPISKGGKTVLDNLQLLTRKENAKKSNKI
ncbi:MAG: DEAD/DEAH box helicase family protein [Bacillota bacterium]